MSLKTGFSHTFLAKLTEVKFETDKVKCEGQGINVKLLQSVAFH